MLPNNLYVGACSSSVFQTIRRSKQNLIYLSGTSCTTASLLDSILYPNTTIGMLLLMRCFTSQQLQEHRSNMKLREQSQDIIERTVHFFPTYLINKGYSNNKIVNRWYAWCQVTPPLVSVRDTGKFNQRLASKPTYKPYDKRLNLKNFKNK